jgi:hypothetical protein
MKGFTPSDRLAALEEMGVNLWEFVKQLQEENMDLKNRVAALEGQMRPKGIDHGMIYDALREIELCTSPLAPDETEEQREARFIERYGTREGFINERTKKKEA